MTIRPEGFPIELWAKLDDKDQSVAAVTWGNLDDDDKSYAMEHPHDDDVKDMVLEGDTETAEATDSQSKTVGELMQSVIDKLKADTPIVKAMSVAVETKVTAYFKTLTLIGHIERLDLAGILPRYEAEPVQSTEQSNVLHDAYYIHKKSKRNSQKALKPKVRHRLHYIYDKVFGGEALSKFETLSNMGKEAKDKIGDEIYKTDKADARLPVKFGYEFWEDACTVTHVINDVNGRSKTVKIEARRDKSGEIVPSQYPFDLIEYAYVDDAGEKVKREKRKARLSISDVNKIDLDKAEELVGKKDEAGDVRGLYDAILDSRKSKRETQQERYNRLREELLKTSQEIVKAGGTVEGNTVTNIGQAKSVVFDMAQLSDNKKFVGEWTKLLATDNDLLRAWYKLTMWTELLPRELRMKAATLDSAAVQSADAAEKDKAA
jgi:hypothetical protein